MDPNQPPSSSTRKVRFTPKAPARRTPKPTDPKSEIVEDDTGDNEASQSLLRRVNENLVRRGPKVEKKSSVQVAFTHGSASSDYIRTYGRPGVGSSSGKHNGLGLKDSADDDEQILLSLPSNATPEGTAGDSVMAVDASYQKKKKPYIEPWDYHSNYPITLPLRRPYSGDPELLDEAEFGDAASHKEYDETTMNSASELGLLEENDKPQLFFLQLPVNLPLVKRSASTDGKEKAESSNPLESKGALANPKGKEIATGASAAAKGKQKEVSSMPPEVVNASNECCSLEDLPAGHMGKMLIYKSGAIKWKLGEVTYDVSPGVSCVFAQGAVAINTVDRNCCWLGELSKRAVVTPDDVMNLDVVKPDNVIDLD
ncbi:uncharacterized protein LOC130763365 [Actinidia eriantha]|uniref:uncharacterized protein LOC130763365 n=1 Tax=Actinidia eriantha TaxID=165200 RepID=UPI002588E4E1|nr:uncharacterized protein LOC130763365 [Actinidia eriantha]XP_057475254.1 uncharacterized protein LOC130763365 [Actinidia eriantha]